MPTYLKLPPSGPFIKGTATGDVLVWNNTNQQWDFVPSSGVFTPGTVVGQYLYWNGTAWIPSLRVLGGSGLTGTVAAIVAAGDNQTVTVPLVGALVGDFMTAYFSATLAAAGVICDGGICLAPGVMTISLTGTKAYAGAVVADIALGVQRF